MKLFETRRDRPITIRVAAAIAHDHRGDEEDLGTLVATLPGDAVTEAFDPKVAGGATYDVVELPLKGAAPRVAVSSRTSKRG